MSKPNQVSQQPGGLEVAGEALNLIRTTPVLNLLQYYAGTLPFVLALLYFWADMSRNAFAAQRCFAASFGLAVLFLWMKSWQAVFAAGLRCRIEGTASGPWTRARLARLIRHQAALQPYGLVLIPASFFLLFTFFPVYAFYQNLTALAGRKRPAPSLAGAAWAQALLWPRQNSLVIWLLCPWVLAIGLLVAFGSSRLAVSLTPEIQYVRGTAWFLTALLLTFHFVLPISPFGCIIAGNIAVALILLPGLLRTLLGIQTSFTLGGWHTIFNTTFLVSVYGLSYLCLDPVIKAAYCLRCFQGDSRRSGQDLIAELELQ
jgi:hypothetical protein